ncbi:hypothetical protein [Sphingobacterium faecale]|uniref:PH (Pleckstrin Homology) domain-containing protein n=1 Tax=Sphingobacterium faecale TaxID=2803775 RepID=A0ABS1R4L0_9SPHI|nr:hypothetical protein [Sphingobacterium faecale]MBL1409651.1 hypothetical protein [Sphingobacterium faecale]
MNQTFQINTLHRGKYMLCFFLLLFTIGGISSYIPLDEIYKIIIVLLTIPAILYIAVKVSQRPSIWTLTPESLTVAFSEQVSVYPIIEIDHLRSLTRSGGNLYVIYMRKEKPTRYWRNKLFQADDDNLLMHEALLQSNIEYFKF